MSSPTLRNRAFTLIELLIVIVIIGILAVALLPNITGGPGRARDAARKAALQQFATGLEMYASDNGGRYPATGAANCATAAFTATPLNGLTTVPVDPSGLGATALSSACPNGYTYIALNTAPSSGNEGYILVAASESTSETATTGIYSGTWTIDTTKTAVLNLAGTLSCTGAATPPCTTAARYYAIGH